MSYKIIKGDLIATAEDYDIVVHGCNTKHTMGAGFALKLKKKYPIIFEYDEYNSIPGTIREVPVKKDFIIINAYTQRYWGRDKYKNEDRYLYIRNCMKCINKDYKGKRIGMPMIGAGLAGGDWNIIESIIKEELKDCDVTVVKYN